MAESTNYFEKVWQERVKNEDDYKPPAQKARLDKLENSLKALTQQSVVLDYGCGFGEFTELISKQGFKTFGLDTSPTVVKRNNERFSDIEFVCAPTIPCEIANDTFDMIWCSEVVEHVHDTNAIFSEFSRLLKPNGYLVLTTPYHGWFKNLLLITLGFERHFNVEWDHIRFWTRKSLTQMALKHGLTPKKWSSVGRIPICAMSYYVTFKKQID